MATKQILNSSTAPDGSQYVTLTDGAGNLVTAGGSSGITIGTTTVTGGATTQVLFNLGGVVSSDSGLTYAGSGGALNLAAGTITTNVKSLNITQTWNAAGTTFDAPIFLNVTNTASNGASLLFDLQGSTVSKFSIRADNGNANIPFGGGYYLGSPAGSAVGFTASGAGTLQFLTNNASALLIQNNATNVNSIIWQGNVASIANVAAANLQFGGSNVNGAPVAQTLSFQGALAGSATNTASANTTIIGSLGTGTGTNGDIIFQTGVKTTTGTAQATPTTALTIKGESLTVNFAGAVVSGGNIQIPGGSLLFWSSKSTIGSNADGNITIANFAGTNKFTLAATGNAAPIKFVDAGSFTANGTTAVTLTALGPAGAGTTVAEWLTIVDSAGTTRYIPCF
jgi:hypothetical protein